MFWSEIGSGFGEPGGTPLPRIPEYRPGTTIYETLITVSVPSLATNENKDLSQFSRIKINTSSIHMFLSFHLLYQKPTVENKNKTFTVVHSVKIIGDKLLLLYNPETLLYDV